MKSINWIDLSDGEWLLVCVNYHKVTKVNFRKVTRSAIVSELDQSVSSNYFMTEYDVCLSHDCRKTPEEVKNEISQAIIKAEEAAY